VAQRPFAKKIRCFPESSSGEAAERFLVHILIAHQAEVIIFEPQPTIDYDK
jgi:hypothetical protein